MNEIDDTIEAAVTGPKSVSTDGIRVDAQDVDSLIKADQHLAGKEAVKSNNRGIRFNKLVPPGTSI